jgi:signal transduction histidine kinase
VETFPNRKAVKIEISDTGTGIPDDEKEKIFNP